MRNKSDSCFTYHSNRSASLWKNGMPIFSNNSETILLNNIQIKNTQHNVIKFKNAFIQDKYLIVDQKYINLENLSLSRQILRNAQGQISNEQNLRISNNLDFLEMFGPLLLINQVYNCLKQYTIQSQFENNYQIIKILGKGSFAKVYKVKLIKDDLQSLQKLNCKTFASKIFNKIKLKKDQEENELSLWKEIEILRLMKNEHIIKLHEVYEDDKKVYLILDLLEGGELFTQIEKKFNFYDETLVQKLILNVLKALSYMHSQKIIHRDIKPENLILKQQNNIEDVVLADFGLADFYSPNDDYLFSRCGSIGYVAPEMLNNQKYDYKVDIYSLGTVLFLLLTGEQAIQGSSSKEVFENNKIGQINFNLLDQANISKNAKDLCIQMLKKDQKERITSEQALNHQWFQLDEQIFRIKSLKIIKKPTIVRGYKNILRQNTPLWINKSLKSINDSSDNQENLTVNVRDKTIQQFLEEELQNQQLCQFDYDLEDDQINEDQMPVYKVQQHIPLVKKRSFP
ncbi:unnamed protein product [Paramecium sonneborni]|uniref:Protein kinase domain-containing protein n=1 Tax=Paramecium sonneborni TaxID=65129 RepID=A0A8S1MHD2_9CILI|nr:unnamed protein product [Paramecium sonneborni]